MFIPNELLIIIFKFAGFNKNFFRVCKQWNELATFVYYNMKTSFTLNYYLYMENIEEVNKLLENKTMKMIFIQRCNKYIEKLQKLGKNKSVEFIEENKIASRFKKLTI